MQPTRCRESRIGQNVFLQKREKAENHSPSIHPENFEENKPKQRSKDKSKHDTEKNYMIKRTKTES